MNSGQFKVPMTTDLLCTSITVYLQTNEEGDGVVRIPREFLDALQPKSGDPMDLAARFQSFVGQWELLLTPHHCFVGRTVPYWLSRRKPKKC